MTAKRYRVGSHKTMSKNEWIPIRKIMNMKRRSHMVVVCCCVRVAESDELLRPSFDSPGVESGVRAAVVEDLGEVEAVATILGSCELGDDPDWLFEVR